MLPKRPSEHVVGTAAWKLVSGALPAHWILREVTERDYGIDAYLELVTVNGDVTGDLLSLQVKGVESLAWRVENDVRVASISGIEVSTVNYWLRLPVPVFLCVADTTNNRVWFAEAKDQARRQYDKLSTQKTITFQLSEHCDLATNSGKQRLLEQYLRERQHERLLADITNLIVGCQRYADFCDEHDNLDAHLALDDVDILSFYSMHRTAQAVAVHLGISWDLKSLEELRQQDFAAFKDTFSPLHEYTVDKFLPGFAAKLIELLEAAHRHITDTHSHYWQSFDPFLHVYCFNKHWQYTADRLKRVRDRGY